uniref:zinc-dependent peptidase n=1 Tax=Roseivirga sp. TaxID=1964215 RepID=UPI004047E946
MIAAVLLVIILVPIFFYKEIFKRPFVHTPVPEVWKNILNDKVQFYRQLNPELKLQFEKDVQEFLANITITGVKVNLTLEDRLLVASSGVIPLFGFPTCTYTYLEEVILYPSAFNRNFELGDENEIITGMVGTGILENKMILSQPALHAGFDIANDKSNTGLHEFIHLFDKENGFIDGVPPGFEDKTYTLPWLQFIHKKVKDIVDDESDIHPYATTNQQEFLAVAGEYFFEQPGQLKQKHPVLYQSLMRAFNQDPASFMSIEVSKIQISRNDNCLCGSGIKYKKCCWEG